MNSRQLWMYKWNLCQFLGYGNDDNTADDGN